MSNEPWYPECLRKPFEIVMVAVVLVVLCYGLFVRGLGLPLAVWPTFLGI